jgi:hypothetical protein
VEASAKLPQQPQLRHFPVAFDRVTRHVQRLGGFFEAQPAEESHFHDLTLPWVNRRERRQGIVQRDQIRTGLVRHNERLLQRSHRRAATAFLIAPSARRINENPAHQPRRHREEVRAVLPPNPIDFNEPQVHLVDERRRLEGVADPFTLHVMTGQAAQLLMDQRQQRVKRVGFAPVPSQE